MGPIVRLRTQKRVRVVPPEFVDSQINEKFQRQLVRHWENGQLRLSPK